MTTTTSQENTKRLIARAAELGYTIIEINPDANRIELIPTDPASYTPPMTREWATGQWLVQTTTYGPLAPDEIGRVVDGYQQATIMASLVERLDAASLAPYRMTR
ncbi:hypothetical protein [Trueperella bialowiezensis]|uniref:Uncharacterized protein n=1 Tax=Trueperella bialowiezensis TaxID=312285 RepID=A0A448PFY4_9ACTO|nr:hypothetical protein [Trueperella bialowiezensis]VEI13859.1 Uncharacterised protein [Trueperella bialowiezensis]